MSYCTQCGIEIPVDASFCPVCGAKLLSNECGEVSGAALSLDPAFQQRFAGSSESERCSLMPPGVSRHVSEAQRNIEAGQMLFEKSYFNGAAALYRMALERLLVALTMAYGFEKEDIDQYLDDGKGQIKEDGANKRREDFLNEVDLVSEDEHKRIKDVRIYGNNGTHADRPDVKRLEAADMGEYIKSLLPAFQDKIKQANNNPLLVKQKQIEVFDQCSENAKHAGKDDVEREYEERLNKCKLGYFGAAACSSPASQLVQGEASFAGGSAVGEAKIDQLINSFEYAVDELAETQQRLDSKRAYVAGFSKNQMASQWREVEAANKEIKWLYEHKCALSEKVSDYIRSINSELNRISGRYGRAAVADLVERANAVAVRAGYGKRTFTASKYYEGGGMKDENLKYGCMSFAIFFFVICFVMPFLFGWAMRG